MDRQRFLPLFILTFMSFFTFNADLQAHRMVMPIDKVAPRIPTSNLFETRSHNVEVNIVNQVAKVQVTTVFFNPARVQQEGICFFPIPKGAGVNDFSMTQNGQTLKAEMLDADKARSIYMSIVRKMQDPGIVEWIDSGMIKTRVFPVAARGTVKVVLTYSLLLERNGSHVTFNYPLAASRPQHGKIGNVSVNVNIKSKESIKNVYCPNYNTAISRDDNRTANVSFETANMAPKNNFAIHYTVDSQEVGLTLMTHTPPGEKGYFLLLASPDAKLDTDQVQAKDVTFVVDTSGSMNGEKIEQARNALKYCLNSLNAEDRFNLISFATDVNPLFKSVQDLTKDTKEQALARAKSLEAKGGTDIMAALNQAISTAPKDDKRPHYIIFLTDGLPSVGETSIPSILKQIKEKSGKTRLFVFGVGNDVNTDLIDRLAAENGGSRNYVSPGENIEVAVSDFYGKVANPILMDLELDFGSIKVFQTNPREYPDLFAGSQLVVMGRFEGKAASVRLKGKLAGKDKEFIYDANWKGRAEFDFIPRLWARSRVGYLLEQIRFHGANTEIVNEVKELGKKYGIVTPYTALLAVEDGALGRITSQVRRNMQLNKHSETFEEERKGDDANRDSKRLAEMNENISPSTPKKENTRADAEPEDFLEELQTELQDKAKQQGYSAGKDVILKLGTDTFYKGRDGAYYQSSYDEKSMKGKLSAVLFASDEFFDLVDKHPELKKMLRSKHDMVVMLGGKPYKIVYSKK